MSVVELRRAGDRAWLLELPDDASAARVARRIRLEHAGQLEEVVPGHRTVLVVGDVDRQALQHDAERAHEAPDDEAVTKAIEIPVAYDGPDLDEVATLTGLSVEEVVKRHTAATYLVAFLGFAPGFGYLVGGDDRLSVPRRSEPRERVPAGTVAIAGPYSGVYPRETPGGWQLLGRTELMLFDAEREPPALLNAGDRVRFVAL